MQFCRPGKAQPPPGSALLRRAALRLPGLGIQSISASIAMCSQRGVVVP